VDAPGNYGNASLPEQFKQNNPWRKMMMVMIENDSDKSAMDGSLLCIANWLVFITEMECAYNSVRTETLDKIQINFFMPEKAAKRQVILGALLLLLSVAFH
jgi:hypothetical protein